MRKVLMIGPARNVKGGMTTVVNQYLNSSLNDDFNIKYIESTNDKCFILKSIKIIVGFIKYCFLIKKADIVHIHMASNMSTYRKLKYVLLASKNNKRIILHIHGGGFEKFYSECTKSKKKYIRKTLNLCNKIIVLSNEWEEFFSKIVDSKKIEIVYNGVEIPKDYKKDLCNKNILFLGRINKQKGIYDLLEVIKRLKGKYPDVHLYICGSGEESNIKSFIDRNMINNNVELLGWLNGGAKEDIIKKCTYFVLPSYFEAIPMSILEAMSYKCVTISTNVGGIPKLIASGEDGFLVNPGDCDNLYITLCKLFNDSLLVKNISKKARIKVEENFNLQKNVAKIKEIYLGD